MARAGKITVVNDGVDTVRAQYTTRSEAFVPDWDKLPGAMQKIKRIEERSEMGNKMTPIGPGRLLPAGGR